MAERKPKLKLKGGTPKKINPPSPAMKREASDELKGAGSRAEGESVGGRVLGEGARKPVPKKAPAKRPKP